MKNALLLLFMIGSGISISQSWNQLSDFPWIPRDDGTSFTINNKAYCGTGLDDGFNATGDFYVFDLITESWSPIAFLPGSAKLQYATSFAYNGKGYVFGGLNDLGVYQNTLWEYNPISNSWTTLTALPDEGRSGSSSFVLGDTAYIVGGKNAGSTALAEVWAYDLINDVWIPKSDLPIDGMWRGIGYSWNNSGYIGLGKDSNEVLNTAFYQYDNLSDSWTLIPEIVTTPRTYIGQAQIGDKVYLYGGMDQSGTFLNTLERINMSLLTIDPLNDLTDEARRGVMAFSSDNDFFITTGVSASGRQNETWVARGVLFVDDGKDANANPYRIYQRKNELVLIGNTEEVERIELYQMDGQLAKAFFVNEISEMNVSGLTDGIYFYSITARGNLITGKIPILGFGQ